jgi:hypothetical protein
MDDDYYDDDNGGAGDYGDDGDAADDDGFPADYDYYENAPDQPRVGYKEQFGENARFNVLHDQLGGLDTGLYGRYKVISPDQYFKERVIEIVRFDGLEALMRDEKTEKRAIVDAADDVRWKSYRVPSMFVLGYLLAKHKFSDLAAVESVIRAKYPMNTLADAVRYARYWEATMLSRRG